METINGFMLLFTLFGSAIIFWIITAALVILFFTAERSEDGVIAFVSVLVFLILIYVVGSPNLWSGFKSINIFNILIYLGIGLIYSIIRTYFFGKKEFKKFDESFNNSYPSNFDKSDIDIKLIRIDRLYQAKRMLMGELKGHVFRWLFLFPVSLINWVISDLLTDLFDWFYSKMGKAFNYIAMLGFK